MSNCEDAEAHVYSIKDEAPVKKKRFFHNLKVAEEGRRMVRRSGGSVLEIIAVTFCFTLK